MSLHKCRVKRAFEAALPPLNDLQQLPRRQQFLEAWEAQEWADKEATMEAKQVRLVVKPRCLTPIWAILHSFWSTRC